MIRTSRCDMDQLVARLGVGAGDRVCIHAFVPSLGVVEGGLKGIFDAIKGHVGKSGTIIVPTFSASFRRNQIYDVEHTKSYNGAFSEYVRQQPGAVRSHCPLFSMAAMGAEAERLMERRSSNCFGTGSVYETLFASGVKFLSFGVGWDQGYTFFMHLERLAGIPARHDEVFKGTTRLPGGREIRDQAVHFVRVMNPPWRRDRGRVGRRLVEQNIVREVEHEGCVHRLFESSLLADATLALLRADPWCMTDRARECASA